jgi:hypothetical protein
VWGFSFFLVLAVGIAMVFCVPFRSETSLCRICGRQMCRLSILYVPCWWSEYDTGYSTWYRDSGLQPHLHQWVFLCSEERPFGGSVTDTDSFGFETYPLKRFQEASSKMDKNTFDAFARKYEATWRDGTNTLDLMDELDRISSPSPQEKPSHEEGDDERIEKDDGAA